MKDKNVVPAHKINMEFEIPVTLENAAYLEESSKRFANVYKLKTYGDWIELGNNTILIEDYDEFYNVWTYQLGHFTENGNFEAALGWYGNRISALETQ